MRYTFRPLPVWPYEVTADRQYPRFKATWPSTMDLLEVELRHIEGDGAIFGAGFRESDLRRDGLPRSDRHQAPYLHPGVELSFDSMHGRLTYKTDQYTSWQGNARAIALSLVALRAVDRYGVSKRGEQYAGWAQLGPGATSMARGRALVEEAGGVRAAMFRHHPDQGGEQDDFIAVVAYRDAHPDED